MKRKDFLKASGLTTLGLALGTPLLSRATISERIDKDQKERESQNKKDMENKIELLAAYFTLSGDVYPFGPTEVSPFDFKYRVEAAAKAGYKGMGLVHADLLANIEKLGLKEMKNILSSNGIHKVEIEQLTGWDASNETKKLSDVKFKSMLEIAEELNAVSIKINGTNGNDEDEKELPQLIDAFGKLSEQAGRVGTNIALEMMPFTNIRTLKTGIAIAKGANHKNGGFIIDVWHMTRGGVSYDEIAQTPVQYIKSVELNDADRYPISPLWQDTLHRRRLCGEGIWDVKGFIKAIQKTGYKGHFGVEILSEVVRKWPLEKMAKRTFETTMKQFL
ncbi:sugar phosphate isomerase/epimerase family protein [Olivibacter jilunii]|uniref:sugar phosphate isomerase/epimerase family protein n=1 Tax=Olivibacter jilunii TaxID=985016 RepID=UPI001A92B2D9|nr:sugar phosphate isomerase/epimerase family protein [Olivibacter jilunii]